MYSQESFPIWSKMKLWDCPPPTPHHQLGILTPDVADGGNNWLPGNLVPGINGSPRATPGRGFLTRHISDGRDPEHRPGGEHPLLLQPSHICQGLGNELPKPISSSKKKKKNYWENPRSHIAQTLAFPINSLCRPSTMAEGGRQQQSTSSWIFMLSFQHQMVKVQPDVVEQPRWESGSLGSISVCV